jgi:hypothetical protein
MSVLQAIPEWFLKTEGGQKAMAQESAKVKRQRAEAAAELLRLEGQRDKILPPLVKARDQAVAKYRAAEKALRELAKEYGQAELARMSAQADLEMQIATQERILRDTAPAAVEAFQRQIEDLVSRTQKIEPSVERETVFKWGLPEIQGRSNLESIRARLDALLKARREADSLHLVADDAELAERIEAIRSSIPRIKSVEECNANGN